MFSLHNGCEIICQGCLLDQGGCRLCRDGEAGIVVQIKRCSSPWMPIHGGPGGLSRGYSNARTAATDRSSPGELPSLSSDFEDVHQERTPRTGPRRDEVFRPKIAPAESTPLRKF